MGIPCTLTFPPLSSGSSTIRDVHMAPSSSPGHVYADGKWFGC